MIIKKLVLHNFGVYASTNVFEFKGNKPIVLIGGMNGKETKNNDMAQSKCNE